MMKRLILILPMTVLVCFLGDSLAVARQINQTASSKSGDKPGVDLIKEGMAAYQNKDYASAAKLLQEGVARGANDLDTLYNTACALALAGDREKAFQFLDKAIQAGFRNTTHLTFDGDLDSLHTDLRWAKILAACEGQHAKWVETHSNPNNTRFITADIERFWKAYDKAMAAPAEDRVAIFQRDYIDPGTVGLKDWAASGRLNAKTLVKTIETRQSFFKAIRPLTIRIQNHLAPTTSAFRKFKELYPDAIFPETYFVIGQLQSGGTSSGNGLLMGAEMFTRSANTPLGELTDWQRDAIMPQSDIPPLVAHESVHFQQKYSVQNSLLCACLKEGSADFLGKLISGSLIARMEQTHSWANARERDLWLEFQKEMDGKDSSRWLYGKSGGNGRPVDLGYWMGYKISEAYFGNTADKNQAVRDMLLIKDCRDFLKASHYAEKFAGEAR